MAQESGPEGQIPNRSYPINELRTQISPQLGTRQHNQPSVVNGYLLLAGNGVHEFWDISNPYEPVRLSEIFSPHRRGQGESHQVSYARFADGSLYLATISGRGVDLWAIDNVRSPQLLSGFELPNTSYGDVHNSVWGIAWQGDYLYVGATSDGVYVLDASDPRQPRIVASVPTSEIGGILAGPLFALGNLLVITTPKANAGIVAMDIGNPSSPTLLDFLVPQDGSSYIGSFYGKYAYLQNPLRVFDVTTDPSNIRQIGSVRTQRTEYLSFDDGYAFVGGMRGGSQGIWKFDVTNPARPTLDSRIPGRDSRWDDQFSVPIGNLIAISDDQNVGGYVGSYLAVHDNAPDTRSPVVEYVNPPHGAFDQPTTSRIALSFSDQIELASVDNTTLFVRPVDGEPLRGKWGYSLTVVTFSPESPLLPDTDYEIVAPAGGITDLVGNALSAEFLSSFRTSATATHEIGGIEPLIAVSTGVPAQFSATLTAGPAVYRWNFGDGQEERGAHVSHAYASPGRYTVTLAIDRPDGRDIFEAEDAALSGGAVARNDWIKYLGTGYVEISGGRGSDSTIEWQIERDVATEVDLAVRYSNPNSTSLSLQLVVNGRAERTLSLARTGGRKRWRIEAINGVSLSAGTNVVQLIAPDGIGPLVDRLTVPSETMRQVALHSAIQVVHETVTANRPARSSPVIVTEDGDRVWVVNPDADTVTAVDTTTFDKVLEIGVDKSPRTLAQAPDGTIWAVNEGSHSISVLDPDSGTVIETIMLPPASMPYGIVFAPSGNAAYVTLQAVSRLLRINPSTRSVVYSLPLGPDVDGITPRTRGLAISADGRRLLISRFISSDRAGEIYDVEMMSETAYVVRTINLTVDPGPDTPSSGRGLPNYIGAPAISPDGRQAYLPSKKDNIQRGVSRDGQLLTHESTVRSIVSRVDLTGRREDVSARIDFDDHDMASAVTFSPVGDLLFVAMQGSNTIIVVDTVSGAEVAGITSGLAPQGLALDDEGRLYVQNFMGRSLSVFDVGALLASRSGSMTRVAEISLVGNETLPYNVLRGKRIFYDASSSRMSLENYLSCASCHLDGGHDGRTWDFSGRGEGLRNTISLHGRAGMGHGPIHWSGNFDEIQDFEGNIRSHFGGSGFMNDSDFSIGTRSEPLGDPKAGLSSDLDALAAYVSSLDEVPPSPYRDSTGGLTERSERGKGVFFSEGCGNCHSGTEFTDSALGVSHDIGTLRSGSGSRLGQALTGLDTPTLKGVWATAPYLHDGSASTLAEAIEAHRSTSLSAADLDALVAYLEQIDEREDGQCSTELHRCSDATLSLLSLSDMRGHAIPLGPKFSTTTTAYSTSIGHDVTRISLSAETSEVGATITFVGVGDTPIVDDDPTTEALDTSIPVGVRTISVQVTALDRTSRETYRIAIKRRPAVSIQPNRSSAVYGVDDVTFSLTRDGPTSEPLTVSTTLVQPLDLLPNTSISRTVTIPVGSASTEFGYEGSDFSGFPSGIRVEGGTVTATLVDGTNYDIEIASASVNIVIGATFRLERDTYTIAEDVGSVTFEVLARTSDAVGIPAGMLAVDIDTAAYTAKDPEDYATLSETLTFASKDFVATGTTFEARKRVAIVVEDDTSDEEDETFELHLTPAASATSGYGHLVNEAGQSCGLACVVSVTIDDDDPMPSVAIEAPSEVTTEGTPLEFTVLLTPASGRIVTVEYAIEGGTATAGSDFEAPRSDLSLTFEPSETTKTISVETLDDTLREPDETVTLSLSHAVNASLGKTLATATIAANDNSEPVFANRSESRSMTETIGGETVSETINIGTPIEATDADGDAIAYALAGMHADRFSINATTGQLHPLTGSRYDYEDTQQFSLTVTATDAYGGAASVAVIVEIIDIAESPLAPPAPTAVGTRGTFRTDRGVSLSWSAPDNTGRPPITGYDVQHRRDADDSWTNGPRNVNDLKTEIAGLHADTLYVVRVLARNADGGSEWSPITTVHTIALDHDPKDIQTDDENKQPRGLWSDGKTLWVADYFDAKLYAYKLSDGSRINSRDIRTDLHNGARLPTDVWGNGEILWVTDSDASRVFAYQIEDGARDASRDIVLESDIGRPAGLWGNGKTLWILDKEGLKVYAYEIGDGARNPTLDFELSAGIFNWGLWSDGEVFWTSDFDDKTSYAYQNGTRLPTADISLNRTPAPSGIWSNGLTLWASGYATGGLRAYELPWKSKNASLVRLELQGADLGPFSPSTAAYSAGVSADIVQATLKATAADGATLAIDPSDLDATKDDHQFALDEGVNTIKVIVTAADRVTRQTYTVSVTREPAEEIDAGVTGGFSKDPGAGDPVSTDATLSSLKLSGIDIGTFAAGTTEYSIDVGNDVANTQVTATTNHAQASVSISDADGNTDGGSRTVELAEGVNTITVTVTAEDNQTTVAYKVTVTREAAATDATLSSLTLSGINIATFSAGTTEYSIDVGNDVASTQVTATANHARASVSISDGSGSTDGNARTVTLIEGANTITVTVTAEDNQTTKVYKVTVTRYEAATPLTATFRSVPASHDGSSTFELQVLFNEALASGGARGAVSRALSATAGTVSLVRRVDGRLDLFRIRVQPDSNDEITVTLNPSTDNCAEPDALCAQGGRALSNTPSVTVSGPTTVSANVIESLVTLRWNDSLDEFGTPSATDYRVRVNEAIRGIAKAELTGSTVSLLLTSPVAVGDEVTVAYLGSAMHPLAKAYGLVRLKPWDKLKAVNLKRKELSTSSSMPDMVDSSQTELLAKMSRSIVRLDISRRGLTSLSGVERLTALERLDVSGNSVSDLSPLSALSNLRELDLSRNKVTDLWPLVGLAKLEYLNLASNSAIDLEALRWLPNLTVLLLEGSEIADIWPLADLEQLESLDLGGNRIDDLTPLQNLSQLQRLDLTGNVVTDVASLANLFNLKDLDLSRNQIVNVWPLSRLPDLDRLDLSGNTVADLAALRQLTNLKVLLLNENGIVDIWPLASLVNLENLGLSGNGITDLTILQKMHQLRRLNLTGNSLADISTLPTLRSLVSVVQPIHQSDTSTRTPAEQLFPVSDSSATGSTHTP